GTTKRIGLRIRKKLKAALFHLEKIRYESGSFAACASILSRRTGGHVDRSQQALAPKLAAQSTETSISESITKGPAFTNYDKPYWKINILCSLSLSNNDID
ncbi:unnamed protein product, partial [Porites evermanni]